MTKGNEPTTLRMWALAIARALEREGVDAGRAFEIAGFDMPAATDADARDPLSCYIRLWRAAVELSGNPAIGLKVAEHAQPASLHALGVAFLASESFDDVLNRVQRYSRLVTDAVVVRVQRSAQRVTLRYVIPEHGFSISYESFDAFLALTVKFGRMLPQREVNPLEVELSRPTPVDAQPYHEWFRAPIRFGAKENRLHYPPSVLAEPLPTANPTLAAAVDWVIADYLTRFDLNRLSLRVRGEIMKQLVSGRPRQVDIAARLNLSPRGLQRRLLAEQTSYLEILDNARRDLALQYLQQPELSVGKITHMLGFDDQSNFTRAFKRWTDTTPRRYRERLAEAPNNNDNTIGNALSKTPAAPHR